MLHLKRGTGNYRYLEGTSPASLDCSKDFDETVVSVLSLRMRIDVHVIATFNVIHWLLIALLNPLPKLNGPFL